MSTPMSAATVNAAAAADHRPHLVFVCDLNKIHSRLFVEYFASRAPDFRVTVVSTRFFVGQTTVPVHNLRNDGVAGRTGTLRRVFERVYPLVIRIPGAFNFIWRRAMLADVARDSRTLEAIADTIRPDIIHAFRTQPEGIVALVLKRRWPDAVFCLTTWGHDFVMFGRGNRALRKQTKDAVASADLIFPDNARDGRLARSEYTARSTAEIHVMPAPGGLDVAQMREYERAASDLPVMKGSPSLLTSRGHESGYNKLMVVIRGFREFVRTQPGAHLYVAVEPGAARMAALRARVERLGLGDSVTVFSPDRTALMEHMQACDINVFASQTDGLPMTLIEALYFGQVAVLANHSCYMPPVRVDENATVFDRITPAAIADALNRATAMLPHRAARTAANRALLADGFHRDENLARVAERYREALARRSDTVPYVAR